MPSSVPYTYKLPVVDDGGPAQHVGLKVDDGEDVEHDEAGEEVLVHSQAGALQRPVVRHVCNCNLLTRLGEIM